MPGRLSQASGFRQQGKHNRTSGAERSEIRREAVRPPPLQDAAPCPGLAHPGFHSKSSFVCFPVPSHQPMKIHRIIPEEPKFQHAYPTIRLPFQEVQRVEFGHNKEFLAANEKDPKLRELFPTGANRLFFGDNLHIMRQLPSNSIDLFYIDPPFFSGRNYNVIFGDKNEMRSFSDIWEGGMPGYLIWLNARLYEMKRLLKPTGSIFVHLDWHAAHYVKVEMDKIFGYDRFLSEIVWHKNSGSIGKTSFSKRHDVILQYAKGENYYYDGKAVGDLREQEKGTFGGYFDVDEDGREYREVRKAGKVYKYYMDEPRNPED